MKRLLSCLLLAAVCLQGFAFERQGKVLGLKPGLAYRDLVEVQSVLQSNYGAESLVEQTARLTQLNTKNIEYAGFTWGVVSMQFYGERRRLFSIKFEEPFVEFESAKSLYLILFQQLKEEYGMPAQTSGNLASWVNDYGVLVSLNLKQSSDSSGEQTYYYVSLYYDHVETMRIYLQMDKDND